MKKTTINQNDLRAMRTHQLIKDTFQELLAVKEISKITVKNITDQAGINRATFYDHYLDKYELLEEMIHNTFQELISNEIEESDTSLSNEIIIRLLKAAKTYYMNISNTCKRDHSDVYPIMQKVIVEHVEKQLEKYMNDKFFIDKSPIQIRTYIKILSYSIYGLAFEYQEKLTDEMMHDISCMLLSDSVI